MRIKAMVGVPFTRDLSLSMHRLLLRTFPYT